jgi:hypothetical protein
MWNYEQSTGVLSHDGNEVAEGYSGKGEGKNNPDMQAVHNVGPIPRGVYSIGRPVNDDIVGLYALPLTPFPDVEMFGRSAFYMHGENPATPGASSDGCIVMEPLSVRENIVASGERELVVS